MTRRQTLFILLLTATYLLFELAFNARLLDVVGGAPSEEQLHHIEKFGRSLSGCAVALFMLQWQLGKRAASDSGSPGTFRIVFLCTLTAGLVFVSLQTLVDQLVAQSTPQFRRASMNITLVQQALVRGNVQLDGVGDDPALFGKPAGKAFLALFPVMATSIDQLDERIRSAKLELLARQAGDKLGGAKGAYDKYEQARNGVRTQWDKYQKLPGPGDIDDEIRKRQDSGWNDYLGDLGKRGWTPSTIPGHARGAVVKKVRGQVPVPANWDPADEQGFRDAVAVQVRHRMSRADGVTVDGQHVPAGLSWPAFFLHPAIQGKLRRELQLAPGVQLQPGYGSGVDFDRGVVRPTVQYQAQRLLDTYDSPVDTFADGRKNADAGLHAARAVIVPPVALFFSLMGAVGHLAKLFYLTLRLLVPGLLAAMQRPLRVIRLPLGIALPVALIACVWSVLAFSDNAITTSRLFGYLNRQVLDSSAKATPEHLPSTWARAQVNVLHVVAVGQGHSYPVNEWVRTQVLQGITYGYQPHDEHP